MTDYEPLDIEVVTFSQADVVTVSDPVITEETTEFELPLITLP